VCGWRYGRKQWSSPLAEICKFKAIQPSNAKRGGMWNGRASRRTQGSITIQENKTSAGIGTTVEHPPRERIETASIEIGSKCVTAGGRSGAPLRRVRQRNQNQSNPTSLATRAHCHEGNRYTWAETAARPYAEFVNESNIKSQKQPANAKRGGMWNGRASRRTQGSITIQEDKTSAGIGTSVEHPRRERIEKASIERGSKCVTTGKHSGPPLRRVRQRNQNQSNPTSQTTRCGVECGMGVPQGVPKEALRYKKTKRPPA
jgi:hypothetical protein